MIANQGDFKEVRIETDLEPHVPRLTLDENQFQQVLVNLFLNAKDAMHGNGVLSVRSKSTVYEVPPEIMPKEAPRRRDDPPNIDFQLLRSAPSPSRERFILGQPLVEIDIVDHGEGIPHEHLSKVFNPFFTTKGTGRGTGLGLAISQRIIESFHGDITIESEPGKGCTVRILLPAEETKRSGEEDSGETKRTDH
jgi:signal transduction histidine kinase